MAKDIYIGAGHGAGDPGAVGFGQTEAGLMTQLRDMLALRLRVRGFNVITDGVEAENLPLRVSIARARTCAGPRVELHLNAGPPTAKGVECLSVVANKSLAQSLAGAIAGVLEISARGDKGWKGDDSGQHHRLGFCREGNGVIVETFFLSNRAELDKYQARKSELVARLADVLAEFAA